MIRQAAEPPRRLSAPSLPLVVMVLLWTISPWVRAEESVEARVSRFAASQLVANLAIPALHESSGLAASHVRSDMLWSHNDSGDSARLFAFDVNGYLIDTVQVRNANAEDWEDMASYEQDGKPYLLIGDTGDNQRRRPNCTLYRIPEQPVHGGVLEADRVVKFRFETGSADCEAIAFDPHRNEVLLIDKGWDLACRVFVLPWPAETPAPRELPVARHIATLKIAGITGMDVDGDGHHAIVTTYGSAYEFVRKSSEDWKSAFRRQGCKVLLPARKQGESICYAADGQSIFLTSEFAPSPLFQLKLRSDFQATR